jgi:molecular chaperone GrpE
VGKPYDSLRHEVMGTVEREDLEDGAVAEVLQNGFVMQDKVLRTAKVRICRRKQS